MDYIQNLCFRHRHNNRWRHYKNQWGHHRPHPHPRLKTTTTTTRVLNWEERTTLPMTGKRPGGHTKRLQVGLFTSIKSHDLHYRLPLISAKKCPKNESFKDTFSLLILALVFDSKKFNQKGPTRCSLTSASNLMFTMLAKIWQSVCLECFTE